MNFCSNCGSGQLQTIIPPRDDHPRIVCMDCGMIHYQNPIVVVGCIPTFEDQILFVSTRN